MKKLLTIAVMLLSFTALMAQQITHTIKRGETLESIAQKYNVSVDAIKEANPNVANMIFVGMKLTIPEKSKPKVEKKVDEPIQNVEAPVQAPAIRGKEQVSVNEQATPTISEPSNADENVKDQIWHIDYFNSLKSGDKGAYGFGADNLSGKAQGFGMSMRIFTNAFLVDSDFFQLVTSWGANYHYKIDKIGYFVFPVLLNIYGYNEISFNDKGKKETKTKIGTGLLVSPYIAIGKKGGITIGPTFSVNFVTGDTSWGGYIGFWF